MLTSEQIGTMRKIRDEGIAAYPNVCLLPGWTWRAAPLSGAVALTEAGAEVLRLWEELGAERRRNIAIEEEGGAESILSDLGALLDARVGWFDGEGSVDHVRRALDERDALRLALSAERAAHAETLLVLAAEQGRQEGAPSTRWVYAYSQSLGWCWNLPYLDADLPPEYRGIQWTGRDTDHDPICCVYSTKDGGAALVWRLCRPPRSFHPTLRAAMIAADKATS